MAVRSAATSAGGTRGGAAPDGSQGRRSAPWRGPSVPAVAERPSQAPRPAAGWGRDETSPGETDLAADPCGGLCDFPLPGAQATGRGSGANAQRAYVAKGWKPLGL